MRLNGKGSNIYKFQDVRILLDLFFGIVQVGGIIVAVVTLILVYRQTRLLSIQTQELIKGIRAQTYQNIVSGITMLDAAALQDVKVAEAYNRVKGIEDKNKDKLRERWIVYTLLAHYENIYIQFEIGTISLDVWLTWKELISNDLNKPLFREIIVTQPYYYSNFRRYFDVLPDKKDKSEE